MRLAVAFAVLNATGGLHLLWYALRREQRRRESVAVVGLVLLIVAGCLAILAWKTAHPSVNRAEAPVATARTSAAG